MKKFFSKGMIYPFVLVLLIFTGGFKGFAQQVQVKKWAVVISAGANIRTMPSTKGEIIYVAKFGEKLKLAEDLGVWLKVKLKDGRTGFVWSKLVRVEIEKIVKEAPTAQPTTVKPVQPAQPAAVKPVQPAQPTAVKPIAAPQAGTQVKEGKKRSMTAFYFIGGLALAGGAAYFLLRKGGLLNKGTATLRVTSNPSEAKVYVDGTEKCTTPCTVENVAPGKHKIKVERELYGKWEQEMELKGYQEYNVDATLAPFKYNFDSCFGSYGSGNGQFDGPRDLTIDENGNIYVADHSNGRVQKFTSSGNFIKAVTLSFYPTGIRYSHYNRRIYVTDFTVSANLYSFTKEILFDWSKPLGVWGPESIGVDTSGNIYIPDEEHNKILKYDGSGNYITGWSTGGSASYFPRDAEQSPNGDIYVSIRSSKIVIYSSPGVKKGEFKGNLLDPMAIAFDRTGNVYVTDYSVGQVCKFPPDGSNWTCFGTRGSGDGQLSIPWGLGVFENGDVIVSDNRNNRICKWKITSQTTGTATAKITTSRRNGSTFNSNSFRRGFPGSAGHSERFHRPRKIRK